MTPRKLSEKIDLLHSLREQIRVKQAELKELEEEFDTLEERTLGQMEVEQCSAFKASKATASVSMSVIPIWDTQDAEAFQKFSKYVLKNGALYLLEKRVAVKAWRELLERGKEVPGLVPLVKRRLHLTKLKE